MGYLKGKSTLMKYDRHPEQQSKWNKAFWARGYYVATAGKARMEMKAGLTFACMNLKKLARILAQREVKSTLLSGIWGETKEKIVYIEKWCWSSSPAPTLSTVCGGLN